MYTINFGHLFHLCGRKIALPLVLTVFLFSDLQGQRAGGDNYNFQGFQRKSYYFGITLGYNTSTFRPFRSKDFLMRDSIKIVEGLNGPGFNLGIVTNLKVGEYFDFRLLPTLSFAERNIEYSLNQRDKNFAQRKVESVFVELPFQVRYKSDPFNDRRWFVLLGVKYGFDVASDSRTRQAESLVRIAPNEFSVEYGAGMQFFFPYFIFSPEIKISHGLGNTLIYNPNLKESTILEKILSRAFTISLHFEG